METLSEAIASVVDDLVANGIAATADQRTLNPPGALVMLAGVALDRLNGWSLELTVYLVAPNAGTLAAYDALGPMVGPASGVLGTERWDAATVAALDGGDPLPALRGAVALAVC